MLIECLQIKIQTNMQTNDGENIIPTKKQNKINGCNKERRPVHMAVTELQ